MNSLIIKIVILILTLCFLHDPNTLSADQNEIYIIKVNDAISPGVADYLKRGIEKANNENAACVIIELDTPGGLGESMRTIVKDILGSRIPIVVYVSPSGARAASALPDQFGRFFTT